MDFNLGNSSSRKVVLTFLLYEGSTIYNASDQFVFCVHFFFVDFDFHPSPQTKICAVRAKFKQLYLHTPKNWTHVYINLFTRHSPYYHLLKYLLFLLKHPVYVFYIYIYIYIYIYTHIEGKRGRERFRRNLRCTMKLLCGVNFGLLDCTTRS